MDTTVHDPLVGHLLDGRYRVEGRIAVGGMSTVYRAVDTRLDRVLALKVMHPGLAADTEFVERFIREAKAVARLAHPNVVGVYDQGTDGTYVYLAMEYVAGCTLRDVLRGRGALAPRAALDVLEPVLAALGAAHRAHLVHRDMKPENVLIGDDGRVKVADFGLVRSVDTQTDVTGAGALMGTVSYLAPEQIEYGTVDQRTDVYACGVVFYEMLAGRKPRGGGTPVQVIFQHLKEPMPAPSAAVPGLAPALDALVARACARDPRERPADAVELLAEVRAVRDALTAEQLDGPAADTVPALPRVPAGSEEPTGVVPLPAATPPYGTAADDLPGATPPYGTAADAADGLDRTSRLAMPLPQEPGPGRARRRGAGRRGPLAVVLVLLALLGVGAGFWYVGDGRFTEVPGVLGLPQATARQKLSAAGLDSSVRQDFSLTVPRGSVIGTDPAPGRRVRSNGTVTLTVSKGPGQVRVPTVRGRSLTAARQELKAAGLAPGTVTRAFSDDVPGGQVISTDPAGGRDLAPGTPVALRVSRGAPVDLPDVVGDPVTDAREQLEDAGLKVVLAQDEVYSDEADKDTVARVSPSDGLGTGDTVTITVSKGRQEFDVPDVKGRSETDAKRILSAAGFGTRVIPIFFGDTVFSQSPGGGSRAAKGATITLWVR
ncbi:Stk1 family PASTA domain-containing Ser/Thr kinase [Actinacidiphila sp. ITFR-21]|uniref:Stk1 family PASTA domain-containing Ser/Thr kinase n=1 Tax=Actinacidiphila sp. ITFR-21 TaxID=3075199 RepID=UPI00288A33AE|nr:Stk1 family PASTA domain-containing Ser/Thr kinase [Streptomyces sp. ITFR-21]WNI15148.1 Stk1 family PASTA domain-containing Ser/Thr kinase [Streptomyces sp. ITFR-21]